MMNARLMKVCLVACGLCLLAGSASAAVYLDDFDATTGSWVIDDLGMTAGPPDGTMTIADVDGDSDLELKIVAASPTPSDTDIIYTTPDDLGLGGGGNDVTAMVMDNGTIGATFASFDFWANGNDVNPGPAAPAALEFYFSHTDGTSWRYVIHGGATVFSFVENGWSSMYVEWDSMGTGWYNVGGSTAFGDVLADVDQVGIILSYTGLAGQEYGIDNFELNNPEPGTYAVLAFALMSLGVTFRGKLRTGLKGLLHK